MEFAEFIVGQFALDKDDVSYPDLIGKLDTQMGGQSGDRRGARIGIHRSDR